MKYTLPTLIAVIATAVAVVGTSIAITQQPVAEIELVSWSHQELHDAGLEDLPISAGLNVVGVGELVYLRGLDGEGEEVTSYMWSMLSAPDGSTAAIDSADGEFATFTPDVEGRYEVGLSITTAAGTADTTQSIVAAMYAGVGTLAGSPDVGKGQCGTCHAGQAADWSETGHASFFTEAIDGLKSSHYNGGCIGCHTVGYREDAVNGGFDDVAADLGWMFPDTLVEGNWQDMVDNFPDLANLANIQCENCHGPGSQHKGDKRGIAISIEAGVCGTCHEEEPYHVKNIQWKNSAHATGESFGRGGSTTCAPCHSGWGFIARIDPASNLEKTTGEQNITCAVCHDPHDAEYSHQLRTTEDVELIDGTVVTRGESGKLCMQCHKARREKAAYLASNPSTFRGGHGSIQTDMLYGTNMWTFGRTLPNSTHKDVVSEACVTCHMAETEYDELGGHSWAMHTDVEIDGAEVEVNNVVACQDCHGPVESFEDFTARADYDGDGEVESAQEEVEGLLENVAVLLPPYGENDVDIRDTTMTALQKKGLWNYLAAEEDGSHGMHNHQFTVALLQVTEDALSNGILAAGEIASITDVPNDQGKQVQVEWSRFGGDGTSDTPLQMYHVWLKVEANSKTAPTYGSLRSVPVEELSTSVTLDYAGELWTVVASQPAASLDMYAAIAPTLYDSTAEGIVYSHFMVSGHAADAQVYVTSAPDSGYSVDNLAPRAPSNVASRTGSYGVVLEWDEAIDADFNFFTVYRGTEPGFAIEAGEKMRNVESPRYSDVTVEIGQTYYYKVTATDFNGNQGLPSVEVTSGVVTDVEASGGLPSVFALHPNYPNPFNPSTIVTYDVPAQSTVSIMLYDVTGRLIDVLAEGSVAAGSHTVTVDATGLPSGLYIVRMVTEDGVFERTITLLR